MTATAKLWGYIALLVVLSLIVLGVLRWDSNRLQAQFEAGEMAERALWVAHQADANDKAQAQADSNTLTSEGVADQARTTASTTLSASTAANQSTVEKIIYAYTAAPPVACPDPAQPAGLPAGVLEGLSEARSAALGHPVTAPGGLQPAQRR